MPDNPLSSSKARLISFLHNREEAIDTYIEVLELIRMDIEAGEMDKFTEHTYLEDEIMERLEALQKVIPPLKKELNLDNGYGEAVDLREKVELLEGRFSEKCDKALEQNRENRQKIGKELSKYGKQIERTRRFSVKTGASYVGASQKNGTPQYIDIEQ